MPASMLSLDAEKTLRGRHDLKVALGSRPRGQAGVSARLVEAHGASQVEVEAVGIRLHANAVLDLHDFPIEAEETRR